MKIIVNNEPRVVRGRTLAELLEELGFGGAVVATAVNGSFTPVSQRGRRALAEGDRIEVLALMQGG